MDDGATGCQVQPQPKTMRNDDHPAGRCPKAQALYKQVCHPIPSRNRPAQESGSPAQEQLAQGPAKPIEGLSLYRASLSFSLKVSPWYQSGPHHPPRGHGKSPSGQKILDPPAKMPGGSHRKPDGSWQGPAQRFSACVTNGSTILWVLIRLQCRNRPWSRTISISSLAIFQPGRWFH